MPSPSRPSAKKRSASRAAWGDEPMRIVPLADQPLERRGVVARPYPGDELAEDVPECFVADATFAEWIRDTFIAASGPLANEDHAHLLDASIGVLWTNAINHRQQRLVLATAEIPSIQAGGWRRARHEYQLREWFGAVPDFLLTFSAPDALYLDDRAFCALVEHELYHCAQALDPFGAPKFHQQTGAPIYAMRGHDSEEFVGVVRRYGVNAASQGTRDLLDAALCPPLIAGAPIDFACGTCLRRAA